MRTRLLIPVLAALIGLTVAAVVPSRGNAQSTSYLDEGGNIHFVDRFEDVPQRYRAQLLPPTPTAVVREDYRKSMRTWKQRQAVAQKEAQRIEREKQREEIRKAREEKLQEKKDEAARSHKKKGTPAPDFEVTPSAVGGAK